MARVGHVLKHWGEAHATVANSPILRAPAQAFASNGRMPEADDVLVSRSRRGDRQAFEELVRRTARLVFARAYLECGRYERAEDLTQETYLLAWRRIRQINEPATFRAWLMSILHSVV